MSNLYFVSLPKQISMRCSWDVARLANTLQKRRINAKDSSCRSFQRNWCRHASSQRKFVAHQSFELSSASTVCKRLKRAKIVIIMAMKRAPNFTKIVARHAKWAWCWAQCKKNARLFCTVNHSMTHIIIAAMKWKLRTHSFWTKMKVSDRTKRNWNSWIYWTFCFVHLTTDICTKFENLCSQICEPTDDSYVCKCRDGFRLAEDGKTCLKEDEDSADKSNEVPINATEYEYVLNEWRISNRFHNE